MIDNWLMFKKLYPSHVCVHRDGTELAIIALYIDDIRLFSTANSFMKKEELEKKLMIEFEVGCTLRFVRSIP